MNPLTQQKFLPTVLSAAGAICGYAAITVHDRLHRSETFESVAFAVLLSLGIFSLVVGILWLVLGRLVTLIESFKEGYKTPRK